MGQNREVGRRPSKAANREKAKAMLALQQDEVAARLKQVRDACEVLVNDGIPVTQTAVADKTGIPKKTLERPRYATLIAQYRAVEAPAPLDPQLASLRQEVAYWQGIAKKYKAENEHLRTLLLERGVSGR